MGKYLISGLCNTAIDNPTGATKYDLVDNILNFLETDTILFYSDVSIFSIYNIDKSNISIGTRIRLLNKIPLNNMLF